MNVLVLVLHYWIIFLLKKNNFPISQLKKFIELIKEEKIENKKNNEELIKIIKKHINKFTKLDKEYNDFIEYKNKLLKNIYILHAIIDKNDDKIKINNLEKDVRKINSEKNSLLTINNELNKITFSFIDDLNKKFENNKYKNKFEEMKKEKEFPYIDFEKLYKELNLK